MSADVYEVTMPKLGETVTEGVVSQWLKQVGDHRRLRRPALRGVDRQGGFRGAEPLRRCPARDPGQRRRHGSGRNRARPDRRARRSRAAPALGSACRRGRAGVGNGRARDRTRRSSATPPAGNGQPGVLLSPVVRRMAAEKGIDLTAVAGSGVGGRIRREDVEQAIAAQPAAAAPPAAVTAPPATVPVTATVPAMAQPSAAAAPKPRRCSASRRATRSSSCRGCG